MPLEKKLAKFLLLPNLELEKWGSSNRYTNWVRCKTSKNGDFCPKCGVLSETGYDWRKVHIQDAPLRASSVYLQIHKRRYFCKECQKPFTERIPGILKGRRTTERFRRSLLHACENYQDLTKVRKQFRISDGFVYKVFYEQLELKLRKNRYPWPKVLGMDEHSFGKRRRGQIPFVSYFIDYSAKKPFEVVPTKQVEGLKSHLASIPGRENVQWSVMDLSDPYKKFVEEFFPNSKIVADKFHVLRLLNGALIKERASLEGNKWNRKVRYWLLSSAHKLDWFDKADLWNYLNQEGHEKLKELYTYKEKLYTFYRTRGLNRARFALHKMLEQMKHSTLPEIKRLRRTLWKWSQEILNYFITRLTNARTEGHNNKAKTIKKQAYGLKSVKNYRLRLLCAGL